MVFGGFATAFFAVEEERYPKGAGDGSCWFLQPFVLSGEGESTLKLGPHPGGSVF